MKLVTIATHSDHYFNYLKKSCRRYNSDITILGWGQKWPGFSFKSKLINDYLVDIEDDEIVCVIDSFDVILLRPISELETFFRSYSSITGINMIVALDIQPYKIISIINKIRFDTCHDISLNAGTYIGYAKEIKKMIKEIYIDPSLDDQILLTKYVKENPHSIHIDTSNLFFLTINNPFGEFIYNKDIIKIENKTLYYRGIKPFFAHGNGNTNMNNLITELGYKMSYNTIYCINKRNQWVQYKKVLEDYYIFILFILFIFVIPFVVLFFFYKYLIKKK